MSDFLQEEGHGEERSQSAIEDLLKTMLFFLFLYQMDT